MGEGAKRTRVMLRTLQDSLLAPDRDEAARTGWLRFKSHIAGRLRRRPGTIWFPMPLARAIISDLPSLFRIGDRDLVASLATGGDQMLGEFSGWSGAMRRPTKEQQQQKRHASV